MHEHDECEHELRYCKKCDVVYCIKCKREWYGHQSYVYPYVYPTYPYVPTITWITNPITYTCSR